MRLVLAMLFLGAGGAAFAQDATAPGAITTPHPTLRAIAIEWAIDGDDDLDGRVTVRYRPVGGATFRDGLPLFRVPAGSGEGIDWANRHAGSLFDLRPGTDYEIELRLSDPDGGDRTETITARTRPVPVAAANARRVAVTPATLSARLSAAGAGDLLELGPGTYPGFVVGDDGAAERPIVIRGRSAAEVTIEGDVRLDGRRHVHLEDVTVRGQVKLNGGVGIVVRGVTIHAVVNGIVAYGDGSTDGLFTDNVVLGPNPWADAALGADGDNEGEGIELTGPGNVIAHNRVRGFRDAISLLEGDAAVDQRSIDITDNDVSLGVDDAIEADFAMGNVRVLRNRIASSFVGISSQPSLGGPTYFVRNVMTNVVYSPFKLHRGSVGDVALHNTAIKCGDALGIYAGRTISRAFFRNNLFLGGEGGGTYGGYENGDGAVLQVADADGTCSFDYDGYGSIGTGEFRGRLGAARFTSLAELRARTTEVNAVAVDLSVFAAPVAFPRSPFPEPSVPDLALAPGGAAIDRGVALANVNDGYAGAAPDLGAHELGAPAPRYGPRPRCGNEVVDDGEACDDGNDVAGDGCNPACMREGAVDAGVLDAARDAAADAGPHDAAATDAEPRDAAPDAGPLDAATPDAGLAVDAATPDAGLAVDAATPDAAASDAGPSTPPAEGCGCRSAGGAPGLLAGLLAALLAQPFRSKRRGIFGRTGR